MSTDKPGETRAVQAQIHALERQLAVMRRLVERQSGAAEDRERLAYDSHFQPEILYHIAPAEHFRGMSAAEAYLPQNYAHEGFIHCTRGADLLVLVANRHFRNVPGDFLMLVI